MAQHRIFATPFAKVYPMYVQKAERKKRTKEEVDQIICWLTGFDQAECLARGRARSSWPCSYLPFGTLINLIVIGLLQLPANRRADAV